VQPPVGGRKLGGHVLIDDGDPLLDGKGALHRIDGAGELGKDAVAARRWRCGRGGGRSAVGSLPMRGKQAQRPALVGVYQPV
jgi:hypothetical protein